MSKNTAWVATVVFLGLCAVPLLKRTLYQPAHDEHSVSAVITNYPVKRTTVNITGRAIVFVAGEVRSPGAYPLGPDSKGINLHELIEMAGGVTQFGDGSRIVISHGNGDSNIVSLLKGDAIQIISRDIIRVPRKN